MASLVESVAAKRRKTQEDLHSGGEKININNRKPVFLYDSKNFEKIALSENESSHENFEVDDKVNKAKESKFVILNPSEIPRDSEENPEKLPACKNGIECEATELVHFAEFWHPMHKELSENNGTEHGNEIDSDQDSDKKETKGEIEECDFVDEHSDLEFVSTQLITDDCYEDEEDQEEIAKESSDFESQRGLPKDDTVLSRGPSIVKCYSILTEEERKELIRRAFELKNLLKDELQRTLDVIVEKNKELQNVHLQLEKGHLMIEGEVEAMEKEELVYFPLFAEREFKERSAAQIHFRLAESQFYRLVDAADKYRVIKVEYVINPLLIRRFKAAQTNLQKIRGEKMAYPVLAFHGTGEKSIDSICRSGFRMPGDKEFAHATDSGNYGRGVYFSEYPSYSMEYIRGATKLLLCQVLPGKVFRCSNIILGEPLQEGCDSHTSPDGKELVIFNSSHILPSYIVHYGDATGDFQYSK